MSMYQTLHLRLQSNSNLHTERVNNDETITNGWGGVGGGKGLYGFRTSNLSCQLQTFFSIFENIR